MGCLVWEFLECFIHVDYNVTNRSLERCLRVSTNTPFVDQLLEECTIQSATSTLGKHEPAVRWTRKCGFHPLKWGKKTNLHNQKDSVFVGVNHLIPPAVKLLYSTQIPTHLQEKNESLAQFPPANSFPSLHPLIHPSQSFPARLRLGWYNNSASKSPA